MDNFKHRVNYAARVFSAIYLPAVLFSLLAISAGCSDKKVVLKTGDPAPAFSLSALDGKTVRMPEDFTGKVVAVRFWADWCKSCAEEMPQLDAVYRDYREKGLVILAVNVGQEKAVAEAFINNIKVTYPVLLDPDTTVTKGYGVTGLPTTIIIDSKGKVRQKILGETGGEAFKKIVLKWIPDQK